MGKIGKISEEWRNRIPVYLDSTDKDLNSKWSTIRQSLIDTGTEARRVIKAVEGMSLWVVPPDGATPGAMPPVKLIADIPELQVLIEQARQYLSFKRHADTCRQDLANWESLVEKIQDPDRIADIYKSIDRVRREIAQAERDAVNVLADTRDTIIKVKTLASQTIKNCEGALHNLASLAQKLLIDKERLELARQGKTDPTDFTDAELYQMAQSEAKPALPAVDPEEDE